MSNAEERTAPSYPVNPKTEVNGRARAGSNEPPSRAPKPRRVLSGWAVTFAPNDCDEFAWLSVTVHINAESARTHAQAAHVASSGLLSILAEKLGVEAIRDSFQWDLVDVRRVTELEGQQ